MKIPKAFIGSMKVKKPSLLKGGFPYIFHDAYLYDFSFKTLHVNKGDSLSAIKANKQYELYHKLTTTVIKKPVVVGLGSYPTDKGSMALAFNILYNIKENNKTFEIFTVSSLLTTSEKISQQLGDTSPEVLCITGLSEDDAMFSYSIENARAIISAYRNSVLIIPVVTKNIVDFFNIKLHITGLYMQFSSLKKVEEL